MNPQLPPCKAIDNVYSNLRNQRGSPLLRLAAETREQIFKYVLEGHDIVVIAHHFGATLYYYHDYGDVVDYNGEADCNALRLTCRLIRHETYHIYYTTNTFKLWETEYYALEERHLKLAIVQHVTVFWFRISGEDVERIVYTPYLSDIIVHKVPLLQRLQRLGCIRVGFPKDSVALAFTPGAQGWESYSRRLVLERMREAFEESRVGKPVEVVDAASKPALAFGRGRDESDNED